MHTTARQNEQLAQAGTNFKSLTKTGFFQPPLRYRKYEDRGFDTPTGKIELYSTRLEELGYEPLPTYREPPESPPDLVIETSRQPRSAARRASGGNQCAACESPKSTIVRVEARSP